MKSLIFMFFGIAIGIIGTLAYGQGKQVAANHSGSDKPAFLVVTGDILDREQFIDGYVSKLPPIYNKYGGTYIAAGSTNKVLEGKLQFQSHVISKWESMEAAEKFWNSPEYATLRNARINGNWGRFDVFLLEGLAEISSTPPAAR